MPPVSCLSIHAAYRCRHAGACCEHDWHFPVEAHVVRLVEARGIGPAAGPRFVTPAGPLAGADPLVARGADGACVFFDREAGGLCGIHRHAGPDALPSACRHFPRIGLHDDRGTFIALTHFCPTAALMLLDPTPAAVVEAPDSLRVKDMEGFEARGVLPPLLRPGVLTDLDGYDAWEAACLRTLARPDVAPERALGIIEEATRRVRAWQPGTARLRDWTLESFELHANAPVAPIAAAAQMARVQSLRPLAGIRFPADGPGVVEEQGSRARWSSKGPLCDGRAGLHAPPRIAPALGRFDRAVSSYLASRLFGNHVAYEGQGLLTIVEWLRTCLAVLQGEAARRTAGSPVLTAADFVEAVRRADLILIHQADSRAFARRAARTIEGASL